MAPPPSHRVHLGGAKPTNRRKHSPSVAFDRRAEYGWPITVRTPSRHRVSGSAAAPPARAVRFSAAQYSSASTCVTPSLTTPHHRMKFSSVNPANTANCGRIPVGSKYDRRHATRLPAAWSENARDSEDNRLWLGDITRPLRDPRDCVWLASATGDVGHCRGITRMWCGPHTGCDSWTVASLSTWMATITLHILAQPGSGANGGGRTPFAVSYAISRRHRSLFTLVHFARYACIPCLSQRQEGEHSRSRRAGSSRRPRFMGAASRRAYGIAEVRQRRGGANASCGRTRLAR